MGVTDGIGKPSQWKYLQFSCAGICQVLRDLLFFRTSGKQSLFESCPSSLRLARSHSLSMMEIELKGGARFLHSLWLRHRHIWRYALHIHHTIKDTLLATGTRLSSPNDSTAFYFRSKVGVGMRKIREQRGRIELRCMGRTNIIDVGDDKTSSCFHLVAACQDDNVAG